MPFYISKNIVCSVVASCTIQQITPPLELGEEPHWDNETQVLYFVDVKGKDLFKYDPQSGDITSLHFGKYTALYNRKENETNWIP